MIYCLGHLKYVILQGYAPILQDFQVQVVKQDLFLEMVFSGHFLDEDVFLFDLKVDYLLKLILVKFLLLAMADLSF